jgi:hypothetical protein
MNRVSVPGILLVTLTRFTHGGSKKDFKMLDEYRRGVVQSGRTSTKRRRSWVQIPSSLPFIHLASEFLQVLFDVF